MIKKATKYTDENGAIELKISSMTLGTTIVKFDLPMNLVDDINNVYDNNKEKISEKLINNLLTDDMKDMFLSCFEKYLEMAKKSFWTCELEDAWVNDMREGEYNPLHTHDSLMSELGLSSVLGLKRPSTYGIDVFRMDIKTDGVYPTNGMLQFHNGDQSPISTSQLSVDVKPGEFYVFPYTLLHGVYPFNSTEETRRTMSYNCNLFKESALKKEIELPK